MKKDKEWLKQELSKQINILHTTISSGNYVSLVKRAEIFNLIDQLEEPEQEKVVVNEDMFWEYMSEQYYFDKESFFEKLKEYNYLKKHSIVEKPVVPQFVADWIKECKEKDISLGYALYSGQAMDVPQLDNWFADSDNKNMETFARAWLDGYTVKKEKLYRVKVDQGTNYLYVESLHLYSDVIKPLDFNYKFSPKEYALKFTSRNQAKGVAELVDGEVEEVTD